MPQMTVQGAIELARRHLQNAHWAEAESICRQITRAKPDHHQALHLHGIALSKLGQNSQAEEMFRAAIRHQPRNPEYHRGLGQFFGSIGRARESADAFREALTLSPDSPEVMHDLAIALLQMNQPSDAIELLQKSVALRDDFVTGWMNLANALRITRQPDRAAEAYKKVISLSPDHSEAHFFLANTLHDAGQYEAAADTHRIVLQKHPNAAQVRSNLATTLVELGQFQQAVSEYEKAIEQAPSDALAHANLGQTLLLLGDFERGWTEYEWRNEAHGTPTGVQPRWDGAVLAGRCLLLHSEGGFGDTIHFIRYLPQLKQQGGRIIARVPRELVRLLRQFDPEIEWNVPGEKLPDHDLHCPLLSLPGIFEARLGNIPASIPYFKADPELSSAFQQRVPQDRRKIGVVWSGRKMHHRDRNRSISSSVLAALGEFKDLWFCNLNKNAAEIDQTGIDLVDWTNELSDFADTAALIDNLDLVISVDTAVAHLAGAMGKPTWVLLPFVPDWRWLLDRSDSPWYPTMKLFRQPAPGDWQTPIAQVIQELSAWRT